ncbi:gamma-glutamylcyclotransferase family protein [Variovorax ginsengisoli]|nr:gamma-glutamylcyclotransferase family protein [Variovorax ginsengisoli]
MPTVLNFAYGSNMLLARLRQRVPSARMRVVATLPGHALRWHKLGQDGSGKCDVLAVDDPQASVIGVVFEIALSDKPRLDAAEDLGVGYAEKEVDVQTHAGPVRAWVYHALRIDPAAVPFDWYKALVLAGAREHGLPPSYVDRLDATPSRPDADLARAARNFALLGASPDAATQSA